MEFAFALMVGLVAAGLVVLIIHLIHHLPKKPWPCNVMGWHLEPEATGFDGCSRNGICPRCHKEVMQDGQGNWF